MAARLKQISNTLKMPPQLNENGIPSFDALPLREGDPHHSAWGLYGDGDQLGTLNRLTDDRVAAAAKSEIQKGIRYGEMFIFVPETSSEWGERPKIGLLRNDLSPTKYSNIGNKSS